MNFEFCSVNIRRHDGKVYIQHAFKILKGKEKKYVYHTSASRVVCFGRWPPELLFLVSAFNRAARVFPSPLQRDERDRWVFRWIFRVCASPVTIGEPRCILSRDNVLEIGQLAPAMPTYSSSSCFLAIYPHRFVPIRTDSPLFTLVSISHFFSFFFNRTSRRRFRQERSSILR